MYMINKWEGSFARIKRLEAGKRLSRSVSKVGRLGTWENYDRSEGETGMARDSQSRPAPHSRQGKRGAYMR